MVFDKLIKFKNDHPRLFKILEICILFYSIGILLYASIISGRNYSKYIRRDQYSITNISGKYYIYKTNLTDPINCSNRSAFTSYPYGIYPILVWYHPMSIIFSISFWISAILVLPLLLLKIRKEIFLSKQDDSKILLKDTLKLIYRVYTKFLKNFAFIMMAFPLSIIDYSQLCIEYDSYISLIVMSSLVFYPFLTFIALPFMIFDMILTYHGLELITYSRIINWAGKKEKQGFRGRCLVHYLIWFPVFYINYMGCSIQLTSFMLKHTRLLGILISINILFTQS